MHTPHLVLYVFLTSAILLTAEETQQTSPDFDPDEIYSFVKHVDEHLPDLFVEATEGDPKFPVHISADDPQSESAQFGTSGRFYLYTKRRYPSVFNQYCGDRSIWSSCVCQFTCTQPDIVDCYFPCIEGCECKGDYVYDSIFEQCVAPEECQFVDEYVVYEK